MPDGRKIAVPIEHSDVILLGLETYHLHCSQKAHANVEHEDRWRFWCNLMDEALAAYDAVVQERGR